MAKPPKPSPFADDYHKESARIWGEPAGIVIWPSWEIYNQFRSDYNSDPHDPKWDGLLMENPNLFTEPLTRKNFAAWREKKIAELVEAPCQPLVRHILDKGYFTFYSNAFGHGSKGVGFTDDFFDFKATTSGFFYFLKEWDTQPKITTVPHVSFGSFIVTELDAAQNKLLMERFGFAALPQATAQPTPPAKKARRRKAKPRTDNG